MRRSIATSVALMFMLVSVQAVAADATPPKKDAEAVPAKATKVAETPKEEPKPEETKKEDPKAKETDAGTQAWWQNLLVTVIQIVGAIATPVLSLLLISLLRRWNIKVEQQKAEWVLGKAVGFGEQKLKTLLKDGKEVVGNEIAKEALGLAERLGKGKLAPWAKKELMDLIEAKLGEHVIDEGGAKAAVAGDK